MKYNCDLISDLLPLYKDDICSEATKKIVEEHLGECPSCRKMFADMSDVTIDEKIADIDKIRRQLKEFIVSAGPSHIIELKTDRKCDYDTYFHLQNEIVRSYREIRDAAAKQQFGKPYSKCTAEQREQIAEKYPQRVQEVY